VYKTCSVVVVTQNRYNNNNNHGSTALYGLGPPLSEVFVHFAAVRDRPTGRAFRLDPDVIQETWVRNVLLILLKSTTNSIHAVNLRHGTDAFTSSTLLYQP
jgi:hypothetical protein